MSQGIKLVICGILLIAVGLMAWQGFKGLSSQTQTVSLKPSKPETPLVSQAKPSMTAADQKRYQEMLGWDMDYTIVQRKIVNACFKRMAIAHVPTTEKISDACNLYDKKMQLTQAERDALQVEKDQLTAKNAALKAAEEARLKNEGPAPAMISIQTQPTANNLGLNMFLTVLDANDQEIAVSGELEIQLSKKEYPDEWIIYKDTMRVVAGDFVYGTSGRGAFKQDAKFTQILKNLDTQSASGAYGEARVVLKTKFHGSFAAKEFVSYP